MLASEKKNPLLSEIKTSIEKIIGADNQAIRTLGLTDTLRHDILKTLISYSKKIPHPASKTTSVNGAISGTLIRWQILAYVAGVDLTIAKWFESHLDALSILYELGYAKANQGLWAVWAAEGNPISYEQGKVSGTKAWCSGANMVNHGLMTYRNADGHAQLLVVDMHQSGIEIDNEEWQAVGMQATDTATVEFHEVIADQVGTANSYLERVGFWHGAAGVAACWFGATADLAEYLISAYQQKPNDYKAMYLGQISTALAVTQQYFHYVADLIDSQPQLSHELAIRQLRSQVEKVARQVMEIIGQALGAAPFCRNAHFARLTADLPVFIRQSHGAFDLQKIGELTSVLANNLTDRQGNIWQI
ncbi:acyl-CoA dehydrogenase [Psychrobacter immobilis]|uniref:acyl-CoA dehydrogenase n=1 Tax=Psychrobacter immobilis TaxID=498 RepID=UPI001D120BE8|nr:acyl-CoA dehydrogenase [Psychrobacter immobilis]